MRDILDILLDLSSKNLNKLRLIKREEANNIIIFANTIIKTRYNSIYRILNLREGLIVYLRLYYRYLIFKINLKLSN